MKKVLFAPDKEHTVNVADISTPYFGLLHSTGIRRFLIHIKSCSYVCDSRAIYRQFLTKGHNLDATLKDIYADGAYKIYEFSNEKALMKWHFKDN